MLDRNGASLIGLYLVAMGVVISARAQVFVESARINNPSTSANDRLGCNVALSGDSLAVSAVGYSRGRGAAYVFHYDGLAWSEVARLLGSEAAKDDGLGRAIALDTDTLFCGADTTKNREIGAAYIFENSANHWTEQSIVGPADSLRRMGFARSVAVQGNRAVVTAPDRDGSRGAIYVFEFGKGGWYQTARLFPSDPAANELFGESVALDGDTIAVTKRYDITQPTLTGAVYLFRNSGAGWMQIAKVTAADGALGFGNSIALQGATLLVGAANASVAGVYGGAAYVFRDNGSAWVQEARLTAPTPVQFGHFGQKVALREGRALIGAPEYGSVGAAFVFRNSGAAWPLAQQLAPLGTATGFGGSVALDGARAAIGSCRTQSAWIFEEQ